MQDRPVVFIHNGSQKYLKNTIELAQKTNKNVVLLGDNSNKNLCKIWVDNSTLLNDKYKLFENNYVHMSDNSYVFEFSCFKRFFVLQEYMKKENLEECIMTDSDACIYSDLGNFDYQEADVAISTQKEQSSTYSWIASAHCSFWTYVALKEFIDYILAIYTKDIKKLEKKWNYHIAEKVPGGICDMSLLHLWSKDTNFNVMNLAELNRNQTFDHSVGTSTNGKKNEYQETRMLLNKHIKKIVFKDRIPYFIDQEGNHIKTNTIHAQGGCKRYISCFCKYRNVKTFYIIADLGYYFGCLMKKYLSK